MKRARSSVTERLRVKGQLVQAQIAGGWSGERPG